jgi:DNA (cytosine-5)-methyltransferase 1
MLRFIDLFAGIGGFHHALSSSPINAKCVMSVELDPHCREVYKSSLLDNNDAENEIPFISDIRSLTRSKTGKSDRSIDKLRELIPDHEILCGGFPCQPFSKGGKQEGIKDKTRGTLFFDIMQIIKAKQPKYVILENVPNLVGPRHFDGTWLTVVKRLRSAGYLVSDRPAILSPHELYPSNGGTPQVRKRLFILATRNDDNCEQPDLTVRDYLDSIGTYPPEKWDITNYLRPESVRDHHFLRDDEKMWLEAWNFFIQMIPHDSLPGFPIWERDLRARIKKPKVCPAWKLEFLHKNKQFYLTHKDLIDNWRTIDWSHGTADKPIRVANFPDSRRKFEWQARSHQPTQTQRDLRDLLIQFRPSGIRVKPPTYAPALVAITQTTILGKEMRRLTPVEAALLQRFPASVFDNVDIDEKLKYKQLGNAVPVGLVQFCAHWLINEQPAK